MTERPWYIGLLLGVAGWFAGLFLLIFVFILFKPTDATSALVIGAILLAAAWGLYRADREGAFLSQLALAISIAGQVALIYGLSDAFKGSAKITGIAACALAVQAALVFVMPNRLHRAMSTLFACSAWAVMVRYGFWDSPDLTWIDNRKKVAAAPAWQAIVGWAIVWVPVGLLLYSAIRREPSWMAAGREDLMRPVVTGLIAALAFATLLSNPFDTFMDGGGGRGWFALWPLLSALAALGATVAAFAVGARGLLALSIVAALGHVSHFYYALGTSLIFKSVIMLALGAVLLATARALKLRSAP